MDTPKYKVGDKVTTVHGEMLEILDVRTQQIKKHGKSTGESTTMILAESGGIKCWFPESKLKKENN